MRVLLVNGNRYHKPYPVIPFGMTRVAAAIEHAGHRVDVLDLCFSKDCAVDISRKLDKARPDIIGITIRNIDNATGFNTHFLLEEAKNEVVDPLKKLYSGPIVIGGPGVGISGAEMLEFLDLQYAIRGDGEEAVVEFVNRMEKKLPVDGIGGLVRREGGQIVEDNPPMRVKDLNALPLATPDRYFDLRPYIRMTSPLQIQTKRGCALKCTYCTYNKVEGMSYRLRDPQLVADEIENLVKKTGIKHIEFTDSTFNVPLEHAKSVLRAVAAKKLDLSLSTMGMHPAAIDDELADLMKEVHFQKVDIGAEAGCNATLKNLGKNFTKDDLFRAGRILHKRGIPLSWYLLLGAPGETEKTLMETFETMNAAASYWDLIVVSVGIRAYKGTQIAEDMLQANPSCTKDNFLHPVHYTPDLLTLDEVKAITKRETEKKCNYYLYYEEIDVPPLALLILSDLNRILGIDQPRFRLVILYRSLKKFLGINFLERVFDKHRK